MSVLASTEQAERFVEKWSNADLSERAAELAHEKLDRAVLAAQATDPQVAGPKIWRRCGWKAGGQPLQAEHPLAAGWQRRISRRWEIRCG